METTSIKVFVENPIMERDIVSMINAMVMGTRLSNFATSHPEIGKPMSELIGIARSMVPNSASLNPKVVLMVGIRDAQLEKQTPERKKYTLKKNRCLLFNSMPSLIMECSRAFSWVASQPYSPASGRL